MRLAQAFASILAVAALAGSAACVQAVEPEQIDVGLWFQKLVDTQRRMNQYVIHLDSLRDAIEVPGASATKACDPARMRGLFEPVNQELAGLVADAGQLKLDQKSMAALSRLEKSWASIQQLQFSRYQEVSEIKDIEPKELCLRTGDLIPIRMEMADDQSTLIKSAARKLAGK